LAFSLSARARLALAGGLCAFPLAFWAAGWTAPAEAGLQIIYFLIAGLLPVGARFVEAADLERLERRAVALRDAVACAEADVRSLGKTQADLSAHFNRLETRFGLLQVMAAKMDAADILRALGSAWKDVPGVRARLFLRRSPNGTWAAAYNDGTAVEEALPRLLNDHPNLLRSRRMRRYTALDLHPQFPAIADRLRPPFLLVPFAWDRDLLAAAYVELDPAFANDRFEELSIQRHMVSIGLRRAYLYELMEQRSRHDALTGLFLRRVFMERLQEAVKKSRRYETPLFAALLDIDHFKEINDHRGHLSGDKALTALADLIRSMTQPGILAARFGGDEFAVLLEAGSRREAEDWLEELRRGAADAAGRGQGAPRFTVSVGAVPFLPGKPSADELLSRADQALYEAKHQGRNRVVFRS
jgi:diguanylate cyclase (GGDEF)-like protein